MKVFREIAEKAKQKTAKNLRSGRGLAPKKETQGRFAGRPLGVKTTASGLFSVIRRGVVRLVRDGFDITWPEILRRFDEGVPSRNQPARPIVEVDRREASRLILKHIRDEARKLGVTK